MKKLLLSTAAVAAFGLAATAAHAADPIKLSLGGYLQEWTGEASNQGSSTLDTTVAGTKPAQFDVKQDAEVKFSGSTKTDSGITVGVEFAMNPGHNTAQETRGGTDTASKRAFATVSGAFGQVQVGELENVASNNHNTAPDEGAIYTSDGFFDAWVNPPANNALDNGEPFANIQTTFETNMPANKVAYMTPQFSGFQAGIDYEPDMGQTTYGHYLMPPNSTVAATDPAVATTVPTGGATHEVITYGGNLGAVAVKADIGGDQQSFASVSAYDGGLSLGMNGFTLSGSAVTRGTGSSIADKTAGARGYTYDVGVGYENGPWGVSLSYMDGNAADWFKTTLTATPYDTVNLWLFGVGYALGPGVKITGNLFSVNWKTADGVSTDQNKGTAGVLGLNLQF